MTPTAPALVGPPPPLDRECAAVLAGLPPFPPLTLESIPAMRAGAAEYTPRPTNEQLARGGAYLVEEFAVPGPVGAPDVALLVCRPAAAAAAAAAPAPALYYTHGGGMIAGTNRDSIVEILDLAEQVGAAVVSVEYRLAPETPHPGPVEDCYAGVLWTAENAGELGIDGDRIVLIGGSAGGGIAAALALMARDRGGPALAGQLLMCPMLDDARGGPDVPPYASPARATDLSGLPPAFIDVGSADTFRSEDVDYAERIWQAGGVAELHVWPGGFHAFDGMVPTARISQAAVAARKDWLGRLMSR